MHLPPYRRRLPLRTKLREYFTTSVGESFLLEAELLALTFITGIGDATIYSEFRVFTSNHTGNTILLAVGVTEGWSSSKPVNGIPIPLPLIAISLSMFVLGNLFPGQLGHLFGCRQRWWLMANNFFQFALVFTASMLQAYNLGWDEGPALELIVDQWSMGIVALLAFSAGGQVAVARSLNLTEITTANVTSAYVDLLIDQNLFRPRNRRRNRRIFFLLSLCAGGFSGGFTYQRLGASKTLFIASLGKGMITIMLLFNKEGYYGGRCISPKVSSKSDSKF
jgi:uncharacterized membrane protein YoaK (UPF0700 family)